MAIVLGAGSYARSPRRRLARPGASGRDSFWRCRVAEEEGVDGPGRLEVGEVCACQPTMRRLERLRVAGQLEGRQVRVALPAPRDRRPERQGKKLEQADDQKQERDHPRVAGAEGADRFEQRAPGEEPPEDEHDSRGTRHREECPALQMPRASVAELMRDDEADLTRLTLVEQVVEE